MNDNELCRSVMEELRKFWHFHRRFDANIVDLARYVSVSRGTVYNWLNGKSLPKPLKVSLIAEWLERRNRE